MIAAILRAQFLSMRPRSSRGTGLGILLAVFWYGFWFFAAWWGAVLATHAAPETLREMLPLALLGVCLYWQAMPVLSASMGSSLDLRKLLVYPAPHGQLFAVELLLRLTTAIEMLMVLAGGAVGVLCNPAVRAVAVFPSIVAAFALFVVFNVLLASGTRSLLERLLARRKVREMMALVLAMIWVLPRLVMNTGYRPKWLPGATGFLGAYGWPWTAATRAAVPLARSGSATLFGWLSLAGWIALAGWFGRAQFERNLRYDSLAAQATPMKPMSASARRWSQRFYRAPAALWGDPLAAIVEKEMRTLVRSARFRMVFVMGFTFGLMFWLPMVLRRHGMPPSELSHNFLTIVCVYAMTLMGQVTYLNCFGLDRSAAVFYFAAPQPMERTLLGKNIVCLFFVYLEAVVLMAITLLVRVPFSVEQAVETLAVLGVCAMYLTAIGNISSVYFPRALSPERTSQSGAGNRTQALLIMFYPIVLVPVALAYLARYAFDSQLAFSVVLAIAGAIGAIFHYVATGSAAKTALARRQQILEALSSGGGPIGG